MTEIFKSHNEPFIHANGWWRDWSRSFIFICWHLVSRVGFYARIRCQSKQEAALPLPPSHTHTHAGLMSCTMQGSCVKQPPIIIFDLRLAVPHAGCQSGRSPALSRPVSCCCRPIRNPDRIQYENRRAFSAPACMRESAKQLVWRY